MMEREANRMYIYRGTGSVSALADTTQSLRLALSMRIAREAFPYWERPRASLRRGKSPCLPTPCVVPLT